MAYPGGEITVGRHLHRSERGRSRISTETTAFVLLTIRITTLALPASPFGMARLHLRIDLRHRHWRDARRPGRTIGYIVYRTKSCQENRSETYACISLSGIS